MDDSRETLREKLLAWYDTRARDLPWRRAGRDPYRVWVSEIMLQQTRVETVIGYYRRFLEAFPDVRALARAPEDRVLKLWEGLGYYRRARLLHRAAEVVANERRGRFPTTSGDWRELPGVGRYTAAAIASIVHEETVAVLDGNVKRVIARLLLVEESIDLPAVERNLWERADELVSPERPGDFNQAMMELGAVVCTPRSPRCPDCPLAELCQARRHGREGELPLRTPKKKTPLRRATALVIRDESGRILIWKRPDEGLLAGLWELPSRMIEEGEDSAEAARDLLRAEFPLLPTALPSVPAASARHAYSHFRIEVLGHAPEMTVPASSLPERAASGRPLAWYDPVSPDSPQALHKAHHKLLAALA